MELKLKSESGAEIDVEIRALKVRDFPAAFAAWERDDEWKLIALSTAPQEPALPVGWVQSLTPESYTAAAGAFQSENPAFFAYCARISGNRVSRDPAALARLAVMAGAESGGGNSSRASR